MKGNYHSSRHELDKAISYYEQYFELTPNIGHIEGEAKANYNKALDCQKYFLCTSQGNAVNKLRAMSNIGDVLTRIKQFNDAIKMFEKQLSLARSLGDVMNESQCFYISWKLSEICRKLRERATLYYKQELMFRQTANDLQGEVNALGKSTIKNLMINFVFFI